MSASATLINRPRFEDELKLMRAEAAVSWVAVVMTRVGEALKSEPAARETSTPPGVFGVLY